MPALIHTRYATRTCLGSSLRRPPGRRPPPLNSAPCLPRSALATNPASNSRYIGGIIPASTRRYFSFLRIFQISADPSLPASDLVIDLARRTFLSIRLLSPAVRFLVCRAATPAADLGEGSKRFHKV